MYTSKFQKQDHAELQVKLLDDNDVISLLECSTFCQDGCDGFAFCRSAQSKCFRFVFVDAADATNLSTLSACSFYASDKRQAPATTTTMTTTTMTPTTTTSTTTVSTTTSTTSGTTASTTCINLTGGGCSCPNGATNGACTHFMADCTENKRKYNVTDGLLHIKPSEWTGSAFLVRCYKGNTMIQMRNNTSFCHSMSFNRPWSEYRDGFGDIANGCFWLGNDKISALSRSRPYRLVLDSLINGKNVSIVDYAPFTMGTSADSYRLDFGSPWCNMYNNCDGFSGSASYTNINGQHFYTYDQDRNGCAANYGGGWWFNSGCSFGNLNANAPRWPLNGNVYSLDSSLVYLQRTN